jgi:putative acetyltransferase
MLTIRRATAADAPAAARIIGEALAEYGLPFEPEGRDADVATFGAKPDHEDLVAEVDGVPQGVASIGPQGAPEVAWVSKVFVARAARRRGAGRALLDHLHAAAHARGYREVGLRTRLVFVEAIALYEAFGYRRREDPAAIAPGDVVYYRSL